MSPGLATKEINDNAGPHKSRFGDTYLEQKIIQHIQCPARSPDLNPIENVWNALRRRVTALNSSPKSKATLSFALKEQWLALPTELVGGLTHRTSLLAQYFSQRGEGVIPHIKEFCNGNLDDPPPFAQRKSTFSRRSAIRSSHLYLEQKI
ncbi:transposable element Tcb1 transposase [Trichonephila clavipes]|nr:transposable element Tcb1 transposase [Trichonephila clavipes]